MDFAELGQDFHLVPVRDHCRTRVPRPVRIADATAERLFWEADREVGGPWEETLERYRAKRAAHKLACLSRRNANAMKLARRKRECALFGIDPMAVQASRILRDVLRELREGN